MKIRTLLLALAAFAFPMWNVAAQPVVIDEEEGRPSLGAALEELHRLHERVGDLRRRLRCNGAEVAGRIELLDRHLTGLIQLETEAGRLRAANISGFRVRAMELRATGDAGPLRDQRIRSEGEAAFGRDREFAAELVAIAAERTAATADRTALMRALKDCTTRPLGTTGPASLFRFRPLPRFAGRVAPAKPGRTDPNLDAWIRNVLSPEVTR